MTLYVYFSFFDKNKFFFKIFGDFSIDINKNNLGAIKSNFGGSKKYMRKTFIEH
jgi:hypothetical protein